MPEIVWGVDIDDDAVTVGSAGVAKRTATLIKLDVRRPCFGHRTAIGRAEAFSSERDAWIYACHALAREIQILQDRLSERRHLLGEARAKVQALTAAKES